MCSAAEHEAIGNAIKLITDRGQQPVSSFRNPLKTVVQGSSKLPLFFGRIIALAGDFYTTHDGEVTPISGGPGTSLPAKPYNQFKKDPNAYDDQKARFLSAAQSLYNDTDGYLFKLSNVLNQEDGAVNKIRHAAPPDDKKDVSLENTAQAYHHHDHGMPTDTDFALATTNLLSTDPSLGYYAHIAWYDRPSAIPTQDDPSSKSWLTVNLVGSILIISMSMLWYVFSMSCK